MSAVAFCTVTASTKRNSDLGSGKRGAAAANLSSLLVTPLWPVGEEVVNLLELNSPREYKVCYHVPAAGSALPDVVEGDILVHGGADYPIRYAGEWPDLSNDDVPSLMLVVQEVKGT